MKLIVEEGFRIVNAVEDDPASMFSAIEPEGPLEAALLIKQTGTLVAGWTRSGVRQDVLSVMAATLFASVATLVEALGDANPTSITVETELRRMLAVRTESQYALLLAAPKSVSEGTLRQVAKKMLSKPTTRAPTSSDSRSRMVVKP